MRLAEHLNFSAAFLPVNLATDSAGVAGDWFSLAKYNHVAIVIFKDGGSNGEDPTFTVTQAKDNAGDGEKDLDFTEYYTKQGADLLAVAEFTKVTQAAANTVTNGTLGEQEAIIIIEFDASQLDVENGFDHVKIAVDDPGDGAQICGALYIGSGARYPQEPIPSAL